MPSGTHSPSDVVQHLPAPDAACQCLALVLALHGRPQDPRRLQREFSPGAAMDTLSLVRAARESGCRARCVDLQHMDLAELPVPCIVEAADGGYFVLARKEGAEALVQRPGRAPEHLSGEALAHLAGARAVLLRLHDASDAGGRPFGVAWFIPALWRYRSLLAEVLGASFVLQLFALVSPLFFQVIVDKVLAHGALTTLDVLVVGLACVALFDALLGGLRSFVMAHTTSRVDVELGAGLFRHLMALPIAYFESRPTGQTVARVRELETVREFLTSSATTVVIDVLFISLFLAAMAAYSPTLTLVVAATFPLYVLISVALTPVLRRRIERRFWCGAASQAFLVENVAGMETLKSMGVEARQRARWETLLANYTRAALGARTTGVIGAQSVQLVGKLGAVAILGIGARMVIEGDLSVGQLIAFNMLAGHVAAPVLRLAQLWQDLQQFRIGIARLGDVLDAPVERGRGPGQPALPRIRGDIRIDGVSFAYAPGQRDVLRNLDLHIQPGEFIGIVGRSGSGKSTITRLLQRLHVPTRGRVLVDGHDLAHVDARWLRHQIGVVLQDSVLFSASIRDNIALACPQAPPERVIAVAKLAGAHEFITELPDGYDTLVEERGANLSGGQRQRLAIARALLTDPRIMLFDEATSALDYESERLVQRNMSRICQGRTVLVVAHRLSTVRHATRIVVIEQGAVLEQGSHEQLLRHGGAYARLWRQQAA